MTLGEFESKPTPVISWQLADELENFYRLNEEEYNHWSFVGNQNNQRTSFIAINVIWIKYDVPIYNPIDGESPKVSDDFTHPAERD